MRLVYFSPVPWASFAQRPHKFVEWFHASRGGEVLWIDPYPTRLPELADFQRIKVAGGRSTKLAEEANIPTWLTVLHPYSLPIEPLPGSVLVNALLWKDVLHQINAFVERESCALAIGKPSKLALRVLAQHPVIPSLYDAMDDFPAFYRGLSRLAMGRLEREIAVRVAQISVSSSVLAKRFSAHHLKLVFAPNACAIETLPPPKTKMNNSDRPVLGYVGTIGSWFDWTLVFDLAKVNPSMSIRLIGPIYASPPQPLPCNIELLPACDHASAIRFMQEFSVGLIPFKLTDLTASVDPIKYYEYRALGLPVISTKFGEMALRDEQSGVFLTNKYASLTKLVREAMAAEYDINEIHKFRTMNSWGARFDTSGIFH